jgi:glycolate oxidase
MTVLDDLQADLGLDAVVTDRDILSAHRQDRAQTSGAGWPLALVRPRTTQDVQAVLRWATTTGTPVVTRGAGTGLSGASAAVDGCILLSTVLMRDLRIDADDLVAVVQPGVINAELKAAARTYGLTYPPDPSSYEECSIGGNIATNAGGLCCVKYGVTRDYVLGLEVVLADGRVVHLGGRTVKNVAGYNLLGLFVGSEGTLGVVTRATLRLRPLPPPPATLVASFPKLEAGGRAVSAIVRSSTMSCVEIMDGDAVRAVESHRPMGLDPTVECLLVAQSDSASGLLDVEKAERICQEHGADFTAVTEDRAEGEVFMAARRAAIPALFESGRLLVEDIGVPLSRIADLLLEVRRIAEETRTRIATVGHAGDGNFHPLICYDPDDAEATRRAEQAFEDIMRAALALGGTITGEHGIGTLKKSVFLDQVHPVEYELSLAVKRLLDPLGILNPGVVL